MGLGLRDRIVDLGLLVLAPFAAPFLYVAARRRARLRLSRRFQDFLGVTVVRNHYYEPVFTSRDVRPTNDDVRPLPGVDLDLSIQHRTLELFVFADELRTLDGQSIGRWTYRFSNQNSIFAQGDAEALYSFVRAFKPRTIIEIGSGQSSLVIELGLRRNRQEGGADAPQHICFEPFENPWLDDLGPTIRRERIEQADLSVFERLQPGDIVFIDSTHVLRSQGDVECEILRILPILPVGVLVHFHDVFTPRDYIRSFMHDDRRFWTEQYVLEAFLSLNPDYEVVLALHDLHRRADPLLRRALPVLAARPDINPGSFWIRRCAATPRRGNDG